MRKLSILILAIAILALLPVANARTVRQVDNFNFYASGCDINNDRVVDLKDWALFGMQKETDLNGDGKFDLVDWSTFGLNYRTPGWCASTYQRYV